MGKNSWRTQYKKEWRKKYRLPDGESNPGLPRDRRGYLPLYYRGLAMRGQQNFETQTFFECVFLWGYTWAAKIGDRRQRHSRIPHIITGNHGKNRIFGTFFKQFSFSVLHFAHVCLHTNIFRLFPCLLIVYELCLKINCFKTMYSFVLFLNFDWKHVKMFYISLNDSAYRRFWTMKIAN